MPRPHRHLRGRLSARGPAGETPWTHEREGSVPPRVNERPALFPRRASVQNSRAMVANHEASGSKEHPKAKRYTVPSDWLASIASNRVNPYLLYLASRPLE